MKYSLKISKKTNKTLSKIDKPTRNLLLKWLYNNVHNSDNPRLHGKALQGELSDLWRYRVGKYRIIVEIQDDELVVLAIDIGIRGSIYKRK
ncbi:TPA: type II toxin-antitoxin system RelE/ParE family toxin [Staphylococcus aureus]|uniref:type II toxin-antitoxin system RelE family toxin n=1 Tax=Staphylococcus agnetis TaxID=985762 RepID=UPI0014318B61|nr:type II toxin-antitoxin system RelE/ParE family toxin [Staphylococcus agnetis]NJH85793.1 type II toxin-antitoxin system RelE/ParE family toxin [Staphylococcus agnetis]NJI14528.1 type II toxin-antitoxin system RelE/ParE family toxin [Staphylococcus agnetis]